MKSGMEAWQPEAVKLQHVLSLLETSLSGNLDNETHRKLQQEVDANATNPEFSLYLAYVFADGTRILNVGEDLRRMAGLLLRKSFELGYQNILTKESYLEYIKSAAIAVLGDSNHLIRRASGNLISTIIRLIRLKNWRELVKFCITALEQELKKLEKSQEEPQTNKNILDGVFLVLTNVCEDFAEELDADLEGLPLTILIPQWIKFMYHPNQSYRAQSLRCMNSLLELEVPPAALEVHMAECLQALSSLTSDNDGSIRGSVCVGISRLTASRIDIIMPHIDNVINFMLRAMKDPDEMVRLEACDFWSEISYYPMVAQSFLEPHLNELVPRLLEAMIYSENELMMFGTDEENDTAIPDRPEEVKPQFHKSRHSPGSGEHEQEDEDNDDDVKDINQYMDMWTVRKSAAASLDKLAQELPKSLLPVLLPILDQQLSNTNWMVREAGVLSLGAIAEGCAPVITEHLPKLIPFLISLTGDSNYMIRFVSCWTLSRYSWWICKMHNTGELGDGFVIKVVEALCKVVLDRNKKVQAAACSALSVFVEEAGKILASFALPICQTLMQAFSFYQINNMVVLLDSISTLFEAVQANMDKPEILQTVLPRLWDRWNELSDTDQGLFSLMECFGCIVRAVGMSMGECIEHIFKRCIRITEAGMVSIMASRESSMPADPVLREFITAAIDLISAIAEGIQKDFRKLVYPGFINLVAEAAKDKDDELRQVTFGLVGDMAKYCPEDLKDHSPHFIQALANGIYPVNHASTCSNALWACGELFVALPNDVKFYSQEILDKSILVLLMDHLENSVLENCAATIGRISFVSPEAVAPRLGEFFVKWSNVLREQEASEEKFQAMEGLSKAILLNPAPVEPAFAYLCLLILRWPLQPNTREFKFFQGFLRSFKSIQKQRNQWTRMTYSLPSKLVEDIDALIE